MPHRPFNNVSNKFVQLKCKGCNPYSSPMFIRAIRISRSRIGSWSIHRTRMGRTKTMRSVTRFVMEKENVEAF